MSRPWKLTRQAETSLLEIALWTMETFGPRQAAAYEEDLISRCHEIASGIAVSQGCRQLIDPDLPEDLRFARSGQHFIVFIEDAARVIIVDFLHSRSDLPGKLTALHMRLQTLAAPVLRGDVLPERIPPNGLIILRDGKPGEPEVAIWRDRQSKTR